MFFMFMSDDMLEVQAGANYFFFIWNHDGFYKPNVIDLKKQLIFLPLSPL